MVVWSPLCDFVVPKPGSVPSLGRKEVQDEAFSFLLIPELVGTGLQVGTSWKQGRKPRTAMRGPSPFATEFACSFSLYRSPGLAQWFPEPVSVPPRASWGDSVFWNITGQMMISFWHTWKSNVKHVPESRSSHVSNQPTRFHLNLLWFLWIISEIESQMSLWTTLRLL